MKHLYTLVMLCLFFPNHIFSTQKAVINVPIADLIGQQMNTIRPTETTEQAYNTIALCGGQINPGYSCPRIHQLLYNDIVEVIKCTDDEAFIKITHAYYLIPSSATPQTHYWILKKNISLLDDLNAKNIPLAHIPQPIDFSDTHNTMLNNAEIVTLMEPHYDSILRITFSVGTRFVRAPSKNKKKTSAIEVFAIKYPTLLEHIITIPHNKCVIYNPLKTPQERINEYVALVKKWAHTKQGCIPYVWGGTSFTHTTPGNFKEITRSSHNSDSSLYHYDKDISSTKSGFDCSGVIARATQICGIPYFCKNTATIARCLKQLNKEQQLTNGDLILIRGHVMIVSDIAKNLLIEARSYSHGYGKLHEIPISHVFEGIHTYNDLTDAYFGKKVIKRKDKKGTVRDTFTNMQLFSMMSVW